MKTRKSLLTLAVVALTLAAALRVMGGQEAKTSLESVVPAEVLSAMQDRQYGDVVRSLDRLARADAEGRDCMLYLKGLAQLYAEDYKDAVATLLSLERDYAESPWVHKARFARAQAHMALRQSREAEEVYETEARRLMDRQRKDELAGVLISFAQKLSAPRDEGRPDSPEPDYGRAHELYKAALEFEISPALGDDVMYALARTMVDVQNWSQADVDLRAYLVRHDPTWPDAEAGVEAAGKHVTDARFDLGRCLEERGNRDEARRQYEDLVAMTVGPAPDGGTARDLRAEALYRIALTYTSGRPDDMLMAVSALSEYLEQYPAGGHAVRAAFDVAAHYEAMGRHDDAVAAYRSFLAGEGFRAQTEEAREEQATLSMEAEFRLGQVYMAQKKYDEAKSVWGDYIAGHPAGPHWSRCQQGIIEADYRVGADLRARKEYDAARDAWDGFLRNYPLDPRARQIMYDFGEMPFEAANAIEDKGGASREEAKALYESAVATWRKLVSKYPGTEESSRAQFMIGQVYEMKLLDLEGALREYRNCTWGSFAQRAAAQIRRMVERHLTVLTERVWRTNEPPRIKIQTRNIEKLTVDAYRLDLEDYFRKTHAISGVETLDTLLIDADVSWEVEPEDYTKYKPIEQEIEIPVEGDEPGVYAVRVTGGQLQATTLVIRSDLDVIVKSSKKALLVFAQDMREQKPWAGARVIASDGGKVFFEGPTGDDGVLYKTFDELKSAETVSVLAVHDGHVAGNQLSTAGLGLSTGLQPRGYVYTDRPGYRPGQNVHIRCVLREVSEGSYAFRTGQEHVLEVVDSQGRVLATERLPLSEFGTIHHDFTLDRHAPAGRYVVRCRRPDGPTYSGSFEVKLYKLQKVELDFKLDKRIVFRGEKLEGKLVARHYYGEPVAGREVQYVLPDGRTHTATTDGNGEVSFSFDTTRMAREGTLLVRASIPGENVQAQMTAFLAVRAFSASVSLPRDVYLAGETLEPTVRTVDAAGEPIGREMTLQVVRRESAPDGTWAEVLVAEKAVSTDTKTGVGSVTVTVEKGGQYVLRAEAEDRFGNPITAQAQVFISGDEDATKLRMLVDRQRLKVGEKLDVLLHSRLAPTLALLTFEGEEIIGYRVVRLSEGKNAVPVTVENAHFPNFALGAGTMVGNRFYSASQAFSVERELKVAIKPDRESYEPGDEARVEVVTTDQNGRPVAAELSLAMVDDALFAVVRDRLPGIREFFEKDAARTAEMATTTSCTFAYGPPTVPVPDALVSEEDRLAREKAEELAREGVQKTLGALMPAEQAAPGYGYENGRLHERARLSSTGLIEISDQLQLEKRAALPAEFGGRVRGRRVAGRQQLEAGADFDALYALPGLAGGGGAMPPPAREEFPETAYWNPTIVTDDSGKAVVTVTMPDSTTRWRLTARGATPDTLVGDQTATVVTKKDFFCELKLPAVLTQGDEPGFTARVHNLKDAEGEATLRLRIEADGEATTLPAEVHLSGRGVVEHVFDGWRVPAADTLKLRLEARKGDDADAVVREIPVRPWGLEFTDSRSGLVEDEASFELALPDDRPYTRQRLSIRIDPGLEQRLIDAALGGGIWPLGGRIAMPTPTQSDAASRLLGVVSVMRYVQGLGREVAPHWKLLADRAESLVAALVVAQRPDGGWLWAGLERGESDPLTSSRALWAIGRAKQLGVPVPDQTLASAIAYLKQAYSKAQQQDNELKAEILHALAIVGEADFGYANRLYRVRETLTPAALAHTAICLAMLDRQPMAAEVLAVLETKRQSLGGDMKGQSLWSGAANMPWTRSDDEMTALALLTYLAVNPKAKAAEEAAEYLLAHQPWLQPRTNGVALAALSGWFADARPGRSDYRLRVRVSGQEVASFEVQAAAEGRTIDVPADIIKAGRNRVDLDVRGRGQAHYVAMLSGFSSEMKPPADTGRRFSVSRHRYCAPPPLYDGKTVRVGFGVVHGTYNSWTNEVSQLPIGAATTVELYINRHDYHRIPEQQREYLLVRQALPAGVTVLADSVQGDFSQYVIDDGEITFFIDRRHYGGNFRFDLVGYAPGSYRVLPTVVEDACTRQVLAVGTQRPLDVLPPSVQSKDPYRPTPDELYYLGMAHFEHGAYDEALPRLTQLFEQWEQNLNDEPYRETARMLLFMSIDRGDARKTVDYFEVIKEKYPQLVIPFDKVLAVGQAYRQMEEYERAMLVFKATVGASFVKDVHVAGVLEAQQQVLGSVDFVRELWRNYPDTPAVMAAYLAASDTVYTLAPRAHEVAEAKERGLTRDDLMLEAVRMIVRYLTLYPNDPTTDDAALSLVNAYLELEDFRSTVKLCQAVRKRYPDSPFLDSFEYVQALALWNQGEHDAAIELAGKVVESTYTFPDGSRRPSENKDLALYIIGQIWHARHEPEKAIDYYGRVKEKFADAAEAIDYFERKDVRLEEVTTFEPGEAASVKLTYRNIPEVHLLVYRVDLMTLYLTEKNLSRITRVRLAGIHPALEPLTVKLGDGKDYEEKEKGVRLGVEESGAYLVICRGGDLHASGMVLVTPYDLEVQEDAQSGRVRVNVKDKKTGHYCKDVHVKVVGSDNADFVSGETDLRGVFIADGIQGTATVIARDADGRFAFYRGTQRLGAPRAGRGVHLRGQAEQQADWLSNVRGANFMLQQSRQSGQRALFEQKQKGVQVQQMME